MEGDEEIEMATTHPTELVLAKRGFVFEYQLLEGIKDKSLKTENTADSHIHTRDTNKQYGDVLHVFNKLSSFTESYIYIYIMCILS